MEITGLTDSFEHFCKHKGLRPVGKWEEPKATILIAESDLPDGGYQMVWALCGKASQGKLDIARWIDFEPLHDLGKGWTEETRKQARINAALRDARYFIEKNVEAKRYA